MARAGRRMWSYAILGLCLLLFPSYLIPQSAKKGALVGFIFDQDGVTPVAGAVVMVKNITSGAVLKSSPTDSLGIFKIEGLDAGMYALGVSSPKGDFNAGDFIGIMPDETAKVSVVLNPYDQETLSAAREVARDLVEKKESRVGRVIRYDAASKEAEVLIERGLLATGDSLHILTEPAGAGTDFSQEAKVLKLGRERVRRLLSGQAGFLVVSRPVRPGDSVYVKCKRGVAPLFLYPLGVATIVAGSAAIVILEAEPQASPYKVKK